MNEKYIKKPLGNANKKAPVKNNKEESKWDNGFP